MNVVEKLYYYKEKGACGTSVPQGFFEKDSGMLHDWHAVGGERQVTLCSRQMCDWMDQQEKKGFCFKKFTANIVVSESIATLLAGQQIKLNDVILEITPHLKKCYPDECQIEKKGKRCKMVQEIRFAKVVKSGQVSIGCQVEGIIQ